MELYHALNRGTDKRLIVMNIRDRLRFTYDLYAMNDARHVENLSRSLSEIGSHPDQRERLVDIHGWGLMGNHYHLLLSDHREGGISRFLQKLNISYTRYFNERHRRTGVLFQGKTKRILIESESHYLYILLYIHCNPLDLRNESASWREKTLGDPTAALQWLTEYRWSSFRNYVGEPEFSKILEGSELFKNRVTHVTELKSYLLSLHSTHLPELHLE